MAGVAGGAFIFCSFWIYHFVDFENDALLEEAESPARVDSSTQAGSQQQEPLTGETDYDHVSQ